MAGSGWWVHGLARIEAIRDRRILLRTEADKGRIGLGVPLHPKREIPPIGALMEVGGYLVCADGRWGLSSTAVVTVLREPPPSAICPGWVVVGSGRVASPGPNEVRIGSSRYTMQPDGTMGEDVVWITVAATGDRPKDGSIVRVVGDLLSPRKADNNKIEAPRIVAASIRMSVPPKEESTRAAPPPSDGEDW